MAVVADRVEIMVLVKNWVDMLLSEAPGVSRFGLIEHFDPKRAPPQAENGISLLVRTTTAGGPSCDDSSVWPIRICRWWINQYCGTK